MHGLGRGLIFILLALIGCANPARAGAETTPHPAKAGAVIEYFVREPTGPRPWPTVVYLHGHQPFPSQPGGRVFADWGVLDRSAADGYLSVSVSLPGYGGSSGPADFAGPYTQAAVRAVLGKLEAEGRAAPGKVVIQGVSLGAVTGALVAARDQRIAGLVLISGLYDLPAFFADPKSSGAAAVKAALNRQTGGTDDALRSRSALLVASEIEAATLILNGAKDDRTDPDQARRLADVIRGSGGQAEARIYPDFGHEIPVAAREAEVSAFIHATLKPHD
jgi:dipeptidyl aminopeptidase/acylaminoacyl peptidase